MTDPRHPTLRLGSIMTAPTLDLLNAALATVNDPEIKRPITDLNMVDTVEIDDAGVVRLTVCSPWPAVRSRTPSLATSPVR